MITQAEITLPAFKRGYHLISELIKAKLPALPETGIVHLFIKHTSAGITVNENADPTVRDDFEMVFNKMVSENLPDYKHKSEGSDDMPAHIKASIIGNSVSIPISNYKLNVGIWQGIYLCEFRNRGGSRNLVVTIYS